MAATAEPRPDRSEMPPSRSGFVLAGVFGPSEI